MTTRLGSPGEFCWMDLKTRDLPGTTAFFADTLGWRFAVDEDDWRRATKITAGNGHRIGGVSDLANPVYPPETPAHIAFYLAVDDVDRRTGTAVANGARLVVPPFDAGDQGRMATLADPEGAAFSLWEPRGFGGWAFPPGATGVPHHMVLACRQPDMARDFYREVTGTAFGQADFVAAQGPGAVTPQWELAVTVEDLGEVAARVRADGRGHAVWPNDPDRSLLRLSSPEGLAFQMVLPRSR
ncbi:VOC family protein [Streptomyces sp. NPDC002787]